MVVRDLKTSRLCGSACGQNSERGSHQVRHCSDGVEEEEEEFMADKRTVDLRHYHGNGRTV